MVGLVSDYGVDVIGEAGAVGNVVKSAQTVVRLHRGGYGHVRRYKP